MKVYASLCAMVVLFHLAVGFQKSGPVSVPPPTSCCFGYISKPIPFRLLVDYYKTSTHCSLPAIVFITKRGRQICANPEAKWVQRCISLLELN